MSYNLGDTFYPHHPDFIPLGDKCKNTRYTVGGDVFYQVVDALEQDTSWDILNTLAQATAWDILNNIDQDTSWHIHPAIIEYIANFVLKFYIETKFDAGIIPTNFTACPVDSSFQVASVIDDNIGVKELTGQTAFNIEQILTGFTLRQSIPTNFKVTRVLDNTRQP